MTETSIFSLLDPLPSGRTAVEASAGTGKTYTLASLVVRYVAEAGVPIDEILIVTFTRAAAAELRDRVRSRLIDAVAALKRPPDQPLDDAFFAVLADEDRQVRLHRLEEAVVGFDAATITTIHGFAQRMLAGLGSAAPGDLDATLVDDTNELVVAVCADILATESFREPATVDELPKLWALQRSVVKILGNPGIDVIPGPDEADSTPPAARHRRLVDRVLAEVHRRRRAEGTLSFDDVLTQLRDGLRASPDSAAGLRRRFRVALIDEFQDTDPVQWELFSTLFGNTGNTEDTTSLVLVADPKQAIYAFRGANVHTYLVAAYEAGTVRSTLSTNWRSDGALLDALGLMLDGATFGDPRIGFVPVAAAPDHAHRRLTTVAGTPLPALVVRAAVGTHLAPHQERPDHCGRSRVGGGGRPGRTGAAPPRDGRPPRRRYRVAGSPPPTQGHCRAHREARRGSGHPVGPAAPEHPGRGGPRRQRPGIGGRHPLALAPDRARPPG